MSCDHIIKNSREFEDWVHPPQVITLPSLMAIDIAEVQIYGFTFDHLIKRSLDFKIGVPLMEVTTLLMLVAIGIEEEQIYVS